MKLRTTSLAITSILVAACGGSGGAAGLLDELPASSGSRDDLRAWAGGASAPAIYLNALMPVFVAQFTTENGAACPRVTESGTTKTYDGGCTDGQGNAWSGRLTVTGAEGQDQRVTYTDFGFDTESDGCPGQSGLSRWNGTVVLTPSQAGGQYRVDLRLDVQGYDPDAGCAPRDETIAIAYRGTLAQQGGGAMRFDGSGRIGSTSLGVVSAETSGEVIDDDVCDSEALSGTTTIRAGGHTAVIRYDGATDCDEESTVTWTYDGQDQGELAGIACAAGRGGSPAAALAIALAVGVACRRRRARR